MDTADNGTTHPASNQRILEESMKWKRRYLDMKAKHEELQKQHEGLQKQYQEDLSTVEELVAERDRIAKELEEAPQTYGQKYLEAEKKLREHNHMKVFNKVAREAGVHEDAVEDLWRLSGYTPEGDEPDAARLRELIEENRTVRPRLFKESEIAGNPAHLPGPNGQQPAPAANAAKRPAVPPMPPPMPPGPGATRGAAPAGKDGEFRVNRAMFREARISTTPEFSKRLDEAVSKGTLVWDEGD